MDPISLALLAAKAIPMITGWIGGDDAEDKANKIVGTIETVTGLRGEEAVAAIVEDPALAAQAQEHILAEMKIHLSNTKDARSRDLKVRAMNGGKNGRANFMLGAAFLSLIACMALLTYKPDLPDLVIGIISTAVGSVLKMLSDGFQFEFGSSRGSKEKTNLLG